MEIVQYCCQEHLKPNSDLYYSLFFLRYKHPKLIARGALVNALLSSRFGASDPAVYCAKLNWWSESIAAKSHSHPLLRWLLEQDAPWLQQMAPPVIRDLINTAPQTDFSHDLPIFNSLGSMMMSVLDEPTDDREKSKFVAHYGLFKQLVLQGQVARSHQPGLQQLLNCYDKLLASRSNPLPLLAFIKLANNWLRHNQSLFEKQAIYEPSEFRKMWLVWKTKTFEHYRTDKLQD